MGSANCSSLTLLTASSPRLPDLRTLVNGPGDDDLEMLVFTVLTDADGGDDDPGAGHTSSQVTLTGAGELSFAVGDLQEPIFLELGGVM